MIASFWNMTSKLWEKLELHFTFLPKSFIPHLTPVLLNFFLVFNFSFLLFAESLDEELFSVSHHSLGIPFKLHFLLSGAFPFTHQSQTKFMVNMHPKTSSRVVMTWRTQVSTHLVIVDQSCKLFVARFRFIRCTFRISLRIHYCFLRQINQKVFLLRLISYRSTRSYFMPQNNIWVRTEIGWLIPSNFVA